MESTLDLLKRLSDAGVEFILVGGMAAVAHGGSFVTEDVDVCIAFELPNLERLVRALAGLHARERSSGGKPPLSADPSRYVGWRNLYLDTDLGALDLLGEITGVGTYADVLRGSVELDLEVTRVRVIGLDELIRAKRTVGRPKDLAAADELERVAARIKR